LVYLCFAGRRGLPILEETGLKFEVLEVVLDDDVGDGIEYELDVVGVRRAGEVRVDLLGVM